MIYQDLRKKVEAVILDSYQDMYRLAYSYVRNEQDAMDIVQESVYKCIYRAEKVKKEAYIKTWVWRVVINTALDWKKKCTREVAVDEIREGRYETDETPCDVINALDILGGKERLIIILHYFEGFTLEETAGILGMNINTMKTMLYRSLKKMKERILKGEDCL